MSFYSHVPFAVLEFVPWIPLLHSKLILGGGQGDRRISLAGLASPGSSTLSAFYLLCPSCAPLPFRTMRLNFLGYLFLPHSSVLTGSSSPTRHAAQPLFSPTQEGRNQVWFREVEGCYWCSQGELRSMTRGSKRRTAGAIISSQKAEASKIDSHRKCWWKVNIDWPNLIFSGRITLAWVLLKDQIYTYWIWHFDPIYHFKISSI